MKEPKKDKKRRKSPKAKSSGSKEQGDNKRRVEEKATKKSDSDSVLSEDDQKLPSDDVIKELPKEYHPIRFFVDDKEELIEQLFATIKGEELEKMVPKTLEGSDTEELKKMCLRQLELMPRDLITHILSGKNPSLYGGYVQENKEPSQVTSSQQESKKSKEQVKRKAEDDDAVVSSTTESCTTAKRFAESRDANEWVESDSLELYPTSTDVEFIDKVMTARADLRPDEDPPGELLELEMRARAIRSLLRAKGMSSDEEEKEDDRSLWQHSK